MANSKYILALITMQIAAAQVTLSGAGATFPYPLYQKWFDSFAKSSNGIVINYEPVGSAEGIQRLAEGSVGFAGSDLPLNDEESSRMRVLSFPSVSGAVVPIYKIEGVARDLRFTPETLAGIFLGKINQWNDPLLKVANHGVPLPKRSIKIVHRSDGSGTTFAWSDYLSKVSPEWKSQVGAGAAVAWPAGTGAEGNEGVAKLVGETPDSIGYVEFLYALQNHLSYGEVRNSSGKFVQADLASITAAAAGFEEHLSKDLRVSITNAPGREAYPIASLTWILVPRQPPQPQKGAIVSMLNWILSSGQRQCSALGYAPLPEAVLAIEKDLIREIR